MPKTGTGQLSKSLEYQSFINTGQFCKSLEYQSFINTGQFCKSLEYQSFINKCIIQKIPINKAIIYFKYYENYKHKNCSYSSDIMEKLFKIVRD